MVQSHNERREVVDSTSKKTTFKYPKYPEDLVIAVKYLARKGLNTREIADRLGISPYTARNIKKILRDRGLLKTEEPKKAAAEKPKSIIDVLRERRSTITKDKLKNQKSLFSGVSGG